ncbi:MAG: reverse transcriptase domain-containing protein [Oscillospiraceae bacterium]|nr:reverse transcriptase domain-containing protein [Oscillospiraceae bacterium]
MRNPTEVLTNLTKKSQDKEYKFQRLYRNLYNPEFYWTAYKNIYANKGSITPGVDGSTIDGMSDSRIEKIIATLKDYSYQPQPARREYIEKKNNPSKKRPLGISSGDDKLVQEVVKMILESIFEPTFSNRSHGFRPNKSCHTALLQLQDNFIGARWFIEGDIEACFDSFDHHVIIELLRRRIDDEVFISLMWKFLKAGYMEQWEYHKTYDGVPQGSGISPILANIYLNELDRYMEEYKRSFDVGGFGKRKSNPQYNKYKDKISYAKGKNAKEWDKLDKPEKKLRIKAIKALKVEMRKVTPHIPKDENYKSIQYMRYADDFLIGIIGSKFDAEKVKSDVKQFLANRLKLKMSDEKTKITHTGDRARFLGYDITVSREQCVKKRSDGVVQRTQSYQVKLLVPREKWVSKLLEYKAIKIIIDKNGNEKFKALHRGKLINKSDIDILATYNAEIRGLYNYYSIANNAYIIGDFAGEMSYSMMKTYANKYKTKVSKIKERYIKDNVFTVEYPTKSGMKISTLYNDGFKRKRVAMEAGVEILPQYKRYDRFNSLKNRVRLGICELCNKKSNDILLHQVKKLKDLKGKTEWERLMIEKRRRTLAVCPSCHSQIHD